jgi:uncharacterized protein (TIGR03492 family)
VILFLSNGHGEDLIGATVAASVKTAAPEADLAALAVVGEGKPYPARGIPLVGPRKTMPSGGFTRLSLANLAADLRAGLLPLLLGQAGELRARAPEVDVAVAVGDILVLCMALRQLRRPVVFLPTAKSDYIAPHLAVEVSLMRKCRKVYPRDALTARNLAAQGVPAEYLGNAMMDCLDLSGADLRPEFCYTPPALAHRARAAGEATASGRAYVVGLLPGSREDAYLNLEDLTRAAAQLVGLAGVPLAFPVPLAPSLDLGRARAAVEGAGGVAATLGGPAPADGDSEAARPIVTLISGRFGDVVAACDLALGLAGTANEQAAGLGKPVVTFPGRGTQFTARFAAAQQRLLGEAVVLAAPEAGEVARIAHRLLSDPAELSRRAAVGRERMGSPGAAGRMAAGILELWRGVG